MTWGDPHFVTFDGLSYDLQTVGEHVLVESADGSIVVQSVTSPGEAPMWFRCRPWSLRPWTALFGSMAP